MAKRRPSGDGMVRKRDDGRWEGRIVVGHKKNGDAIFRYVYAPTQKELSAKLRQHIDSYQGADLTEQSRMTLSEWLDKWLEDMENTLRPNTLRNYRSYIENHVRPSLGDKQLTRITPKDVQRFYEKLNDTLASGTVRRIHTTLHGALKAAQQAHLIASNPTEQITAPRFSYRAKQVLTDEQLDVFMRVIAEDEIWCDFFYTELTTGLRRGELCGLKWRDFDSETGTLNVRANLDNKDGELKSGLYVTITLPYSEKRDAVLVHDASIGTDQLGKYLYIVNDSNIVRYRHIEPGQLVDDTLRQVVSGLEPNERYVTTALLKVRDGMSITPIK